MRQRRRNTGNGRAFLTPPASGAQWERGAVGNAEWTAVLFPEVLRRAGLKDSVREVVFEGADRGEIKEPPGPAGNIHYARKLRLQMSRTALPESPLERLERVVHPWTSYLVQPFFALVNAGGVR